MPKKKNGTHFSRIERQAITEFIKNLRKKQLLLGNLILFGSRARGNHTSNSDIDLLAVIQENQAKDYLYKAVASVLSEFGIYLSVKAFTQKEFERLNRLNTPFMENIKKEGVTLWQKQ